MAKKNAEITEAAEATEKREVFRMDDNAVINYGKAEDGTAYSAENSPKKGEGTKARWALYTDGMTVTEALAAGLTRSNIRKDRRAGFVTITNPEKAEAPAAAEAE